MREYLLAISIGVSLAAGVAGCRSVPLNEARLTGSKALDLVGEYRHELAFQEGAFAERRNVGVVVLTGPYGEALFHYKGYPNRFDLLLREGEQTVLYRRIGRRPTMVADGRLIPNPVGVEAQRKDGRLTGSYDVVVDRSDLRGFGPAFEHYPRQMRVVGRFDVPAYEEAIGPPAHGEELPPRIWVAPPGRKPDALIPEEPVGPPEPSSRRAVLERGRSQSAPTHDGGCVPISVARASPCRRGVSLARAAAFMLRGDGPREMNLAARAVRALYASLQRSV